MPSTVEILEQKEAENGWKIKARVDGLDFEVSLDKEYWRELAGEKEGPAGLVRRSFEFLLEREPKESILRRFDLRDIGRYFPEYPGAIKPPTPKTTSLQT